MQLENQVTSLTPSQRLRELGVKQESVYFYCGGHTYYHNDPDKGEYEECPAKNDLVNEEYCESAGMTMEFAISAFTVAELGEMLGRATEENLVRAYGHVFNVPDTRFITATGLQACMSRPDIGAKMLIYLLENKLITV